MFDRYCPVKTGELTSAGLERFLMREKWTRCGQQDLFLVKAMRAKLRGKSCTSRHRSRTWRRFCRVSMTSCSRPPPRSFSLMDHLPNSELMKYFPQHCGPRLTTSTRKCTTCASLARIALTRASSCGG
uniref:(northern house mosquito) hypothetical protein n=1 Tax=Culex pipiens TaxID=7175 RepID=A0A8D8L2E1_CULPI